jgi:lipopolysaccharide export system protein LptC
MRRSVLSAMVVLACAASCRPRRILDESPPPLVTLNGVRLVYFQGNELAAAGTADQATFERSGGDLTASNVLIRFRSRAEPAGLRPALGGMELRAPLVVGNRGQKLAEGQQGVVLRTGSGIVARSEKARIDGLGMIVDGRTPVWVDGPNYSINAGGYRFDLNGEDMDFDGEVATRLGRGR